MNTHTHITHGVMNRWNFLFHQIFIEVIFLSPSNPKQPELSGVLTADVFRPRSGIPAHRLITGEKYKSLTYNQIY